MSPMAHIPLEIDPKLDLSSPHFVSLNCRPEFLSSFQSTFEPINKRFALCTLKEINPAVTHIFYNEGVNVIDARIALSFVFTLVNKYDSKFIDAWSAGIPEITKEMNYQEQTEQYVQEVVGKLIKTCLDPYINKSAEELHKIDLLFEMAKIMFLKLESDTADFQKDWFSRIIYASTIKKSIALKEHFNKALQSYEEIMKRTADSRQKFDEIRKKDTVLGYDCQETKTFLVNRDKFILELVDLLDKYFKASEMKRFKL